MVNALYLWNQRGKARLKVADRFGVLELYKLGSKLTRREPLGLISLLLLP